jgi:hypothetical protein
VDVAKKHQYLNYPAFKYGHISSVFIMRQSWQLNENHLYKAAHPKYVWGKLRIHVEM